MSFIEVQNAFMAHIRDPEHNERPSDITEERMRVYRELFFNNIEGFVSSAFPVLKSLYDEQQWLKLVRLFFIRHNCESPYFLDISAEFLAFLQNDYILQDDDPNFLLELAHYEWVELDVSVCHEEATQKSITDINQDGLYLSNVARNLSYQFPVHQISDEYQPTNPSEQPNYFIVYRDNDDEVSFINSNPMTAVLLEQLSNYAGISIADLVKQLSTLLPQYNEQQLLAGATQTLQALAELGIVVTK